MFDGYEYHRLTLFHVLWLASLAMGCCLGIAIGGQHFGAAGGIAGAVVGLVVGHITGGLPRVFSEKLFFRRLDRSSNGELRDMVADADWNFCHTMALLKLAARGEDVRVELPRILNLLENESTLTRRFGWDALRIVFTEEYHLVENYDPTRATEDCRRKIARLRAYLTDLS